MAIASATRRHRSRNQQRLGAADVSQWPLETSAAFALLESLGYRATRTRLEYLVSLGEFTAPKKFTGRILWCQADVLDLEDVLESCRWWLPFHPHHAGKMTAAEQAQLCSAVPDDVFACLSEAGRRSSRQKRLRANWRRVSSQPQSVARELTAATA